MNNKIDITKNNSELNISIKHSGLQGKFKGGTLNLIYLFVQFHILGIIVPFLVLPHPPFIYLYLRTIVNALFAIWEIRFICLVLYSYFGFTRIIIDRENFIIEKGLGKFAREVCGKTTKIKGVEIKPVEVFSNQYKLRSFSSKQNVSYACYLFSNSEYCFGAMCSREVLEQIALRINDYLTQKK